MNAALQNRKQTTGYQSLHDANNANNAYYESEDAGPFNKSSENITKKRANYSVDAMGNTQSVGLPVIGGKLKRLPLP